MAKSYTRKKYDKLPVEVTKPLDTFTDYLQRWTQYELGRLQQNRTAICTPVKGGYRIGTYSLKVYPNKMCEVMDRDDEIIHTFKDKVSAVLYTIYTIKRYFKVADEILHTDQEINKNYIDVLTMRRCMMAARKRLDFDSSDIREARLDVAETKLKRAEEHMKKLHHTAKINKVWE
jgi:predicted RNase H-like nuclease